MVRGAGGRRGALDMASQLAGLHANFFKPIIGLECGLTDPITDLNMGQTAEILAHRFAITRAHADPAKVATSPSITAGPASSRRAGPRPPWQFRRDDLPKDGLMIENQRSYG